MKRTLLNNWHKEHHAKMIEFAGWEMPLVYTSIREEHQTVREEAGIFDLSHMGRIRVRGADRTPFVQYVFTNDLENLAEGAIHYGFLCNPRGGVVDDVTVYKAEDYLMLVVNASNTKKVYTWLQQNASNFDIEIEDSGVSILMMAIQGPKSLEILNEISGSDFSSMKNYTFTVEQINRAKAIVSRTGYTGEDGFEIYCGSMYLQSLWEQFLDIGSEKGLKPIGLGARDTLRTEACMPLYGNELDEKTTPIEAGLARFVKLYKSDFIGKSAMVFSSESEFTKKLICFEMVEKAIPRNGYTVIYKGSPIGKVTTGTFSPTLQKGIGMAYVDKTISKPDTPVQIKISGRLHDAVIRKRPLYKRRKT